MVDPNSCPLRYGVDEASLPVSAMMANLPTWQPLVDPTIALAGGYSHLVFALGGDHVLHLPSRNSPGPLRHGSVILHRLHARSDLASAESRLPRVFASFDAGIGANSVTKVKWQDGMF